MSLDNLPVEWSKEQLGLIVNFIDYRGKTPTKTSEGIPLITAKNIRDGYINREPREYIAEDAYDEWMTRGIPLLNDLVITTEAPMGNVALLNIQEKFALAQRAICLNFEYNQNISKFIYYYLRSQSFKADLQEKATGTTVQGIKAAELKKIFVPLAPLAEQQEIVRQLDVMLAQVEQIKARLDAIPAILKKFRQSVLADAVSGKLTEGWRGTSEINDWHDKTLGDIAIVKTGKTPSRKESKFWENASIPWLTSSATGNNFTDSADEFISEIASKECNLIPFPKGTLLLAMYGEGKTRGQVTELLIEATCNQACAAILVNNEIAHTSFVKIRLLENYETIRKAASGGNQPNLNLNKVREIEIAVPSIDEQIEIVRIVKSLFVYADKVEGTVQSVQKRVNLLTQSILAKAFSGELTAEWREQYQELITGINSAESLLAKIQAEREASKPVKKTRAKKDA